jgi:tetratricopeptide (TPR) repeat protein
MTLKRFYVHILLGIGLLAVSSNLGFAEQLEEQLLQYGDLHDQKFEATEALKCYLEALKSDPKNASILVRIARQYRHQMTDAGTKEEKLRLGHLALQCSEAAAGLDTKDPEAQISVAITYGKMLPFLGTKEQVEATPRIKNSVDCTLRLDPKNDTAWHILGRWNRVLADVSRLKRALAGIAYGNLPKGNNEEAARCLEKAISLNPNRLMHYIELGQVYGQMGRKEAARRAILKGISMPNKEKDDPETKEHGREELKKLQ